MEGPPFVNHSKFQEDLGHRCLRSSHNRLDMGGITENSPVIGGVRTGNLTLSNDVANRLPRRRRPITLQNMCSSSGMLPHPQQASQLMN